VARAERIARPSAEPSCCPVFRSPAARPALSSPTPAFAAVVAPVKTPPRSLELERQRLDAPNEPGKLVPLGVRLESVQISAGHW